MDIFSYNQKALERVNSEIEYYSAEIRKLPKGKLIASKKKRGMAYYQSLNHEKIYIKAADREIAKKLAIKRFLQEVVINLEVEKEGLQNYLNSYIKFSMDKFIEKNDRLMELIPKDELYNCVLKRGPYNNNTQSAFELLNNPVWMNKVAADPFTYKILSDHISEDRNGKKTWKYTKDSDFYSEMKNIKTMCGIKVRSKSEALIADALFRAGILFVYELPYETNKKIYHPDFFIFHPLSGRGIILEHGGLFFDRSYASNYNESNKVQAKDYTIKFAEKTRDYINDGWVPGVNLFFTGETMFQKFNSTSIQAIINEHLLN